MPEKLYFIIDDCDEQKKNMTLNEIESQNYTKGNMHSKIGFVMYLLVPVMRVEFMEE